MAQDWISGQHLFGRIMLWPNMWADTPKYYLAPETAFPNGLVIPAELQGRTLVFSSFSSLPATAVFNKLDEICAPSYNPGCTYSSDVKQALYGTAWDTRFQCSSQSRAFLFSKDANVTVSGILVGLCGFPSRTRAGGAFQITRGSVGISVINSILYYSDARDGGAVQVSVGSSATIEGTVIWRSGTAPDNGLMTMRGGCISVTDGSTLRLVGSKLQQCYARTVTGQYSHSGSGGGIFVLNSQLQLRQSSISGSYASMYGGAVAIVGDASDVSMSQLSIVAACAGISGGAIFVQDATVALSELSIQNTTYPCPLGTNAFSGASALHVAGTAVVSVAQSNITRVLAPAIVVSSGGNLTFTNSLVQGRGTSNMNSGAPLPSAILVEAGSFAQTGSYVGDMSSTTQVVACSPLATQTGCVPCTSCSGLCNDQGCDSNGYNRMCEERVGLGSKYISSNGSCTAPINPNSATSLSGVNLVILLCMAATATVLSCFA